MKESLYEIPEGCICKGDGLMGMKCNAASHARLKPPPSNLDRIKAALSHDVFHESNGPWEPRDFPLMWKKDIAKAVATIINAAPALIAEVERLRQDNEATDGTDVAHPSYWRGCDATFAAMCEQLRKILDGEDDCAGVCQEPWDTLRRRVLALRSDCFALAAHQCKHPSGDDYGNPVCEEVERLTAENETLKADPTGSYAMGEQKIIDLLGAANARVQRLTQELATAKDVGAAEELRELLTAYYATHQGGSNPDADDCQCAKCRWYREAEIRKGIK